MRILHIMAGRTSTAAENYVTDLILNLQAAGVEQYAVTRKNTPRFAELKHSGVRMASEALRGSFRFWRRFKLRWLIKRKKPDIIQCWGKGDDGLVPACKTPIVGWFGGSYDPRHFVRCDHLVGATKDIVTHIAVHGVSEKRAHFIPVFSSVAALPPLDRALLSTPREAKVALSLSSLHPDKGQDVLLRAVTDMPNLYIWLAGEGPSRHELERQAAALGILERVRFVGERSDRGGLLRAADLCVLPSRREISGAIVVEAWAAGTPIVACQHAGHIEDGVNGLIAPAADAAALAVAIGRVTDDEGLRRRLIAQGYASYIKSYTRESVTQQWMQLYQKLAEAS